jgi:hypothetical protein
MTAPGHDAPDPARMNPALLRRLRRALGLPRLCYRCGVEQAKYHRTCPACVKLLHKARWQRMKLAMDGHLSLREIPHRAHVSPRWFRRRPHGHTTAGWHSVRGRYGMRVFRARLEAAGVVWEDYWRWAGAHRWHVTRRMTQPGCYFCLPKAQQTLGRRRPRGSR